MRLKSGAKVGHRCASIGHRNDFFLKKAYWVNRITPEKSECFGEELWVIFFVVKEYLRLMGCTE